MDRMSQYQTIMFKPALDAGWTAPGLELGKASCATDFSEHPSALTAWG